MASRKFFHTLQLCTDFGELSLFDVLEQMDKYVICIILGTAGFKSANWDFTSSASAMEDLSQKGTKLESWMMKSWESRNNSQGQAESWDQLQTEKLSREFRSGEKGIQL